MIMLNKYGTHFELNFQNRVSNKSREGLFPEASPQYKTGFVYIPTSKVTDKTNELNHMK